LDFLRRLIRDADGRKVHLVLDGHPVHRAKLVRAFAERHTEQIALHFLPGYSPQLNPVELLNGDVKANAVGRRRHRTLTETADTLRAYLRRRQRQPHIVTRFFCHPDVRYAA
jgi:transposase